MIVVGLLMVISSRPKKGVTVVPQKGEEDKKVEGAAASVNAPTEHTVVASGAIVETDFDKLYNMLNKKKQLSLSAISAEFRIDKKKAEEWGDIFESYDIGRLEYPLFGEPVLIAKGVAEVAKKSSVPKKQSGGKMIVAFVLILLLILGGIGYYVFTSWFGGEEFVPQEKILSTPVPKAPAGANGTSRSGSNGSSSTAPNAAGGT